MKKIYYEQVNQHTNNRPFSIHRTVVNYETTNALYLHYHPEAEFLFLHSGNMIMHIEGMEIPMEAGDAIYIPKLVIHNAVKELQSPCEFSAVVFSENWLLGAEDNIFLNSIYSSGTKSFCYFSGDEEKNDTILSCLKKCNELMEQKVENYELLLKGLLLIVFQNMINLYFGDLLHGERKENPLQKSIEYMQAHLNEEITLEILAKTCGYSVSHFGHRFKEYTGFTPFEYLNRIRIIKVSEQLVSSQETIARIATECGFNNISYFNRVFEKEFGVTPRKYRNSAREEHATLF